MEALTAVREGRVRPRDGIPPAIPSSVASQSTTSLPHRFEPENTASPPTGVGKSHGTTDAAGEGRVKDRTDLNAAIPPSARLTPVADQARRRPAAEPIAPDRDRDHDRVVRVTAESLTRLMGLAGEALVQTHRLPSLVDSLWRLKGRKRDFWSRYRSWKTVCRARSCAARRRARATGQSQGSGLPRLAAAGRDGRGDRGVCPRQ